MGAPSTIPPPALPAKEEAERADSAARSPRKPFREPTVRFPVNGSSPGAAAASLGARLGPGERTNVGTAARDLAPLDSHADFKRPDGGADPVALLEQQATSRVPDLVPVRYGRMLSSPFSYYRGAALPMAADLAGTPVTGLTVQACGDAHLSNFGIFGSPERRLLFDLNDFDETLPGPWEWDIKRLAASLEVAVAGERVLWKAADRDRGRGGRAATVWRCAEFAGR